MKKTLSIILAVIMIMTMAVSFTSCGSKDTFILGLDNSFPPMGFVDENGETVGFDIDVAKEACDRLGLELEIMPIDWDAKHQELDSGNIDCIWNGFTISQERMEKCTLSEPYMKNRQVIVVNDDSTIDSLDDLNGLKLALQADSTAEKALNDNPDVKDSLAEVLPFDDNNKALLDLKAGGCDAVLMDEVVANYYVQKGDSYKVLDESLADEEYVIAFRKDDTELCEKITNVLKEMAEDGTLAEISTKWFCKDVTTIGK